MASWNHFVISKASPRPVAITQYESRLLTYLKALAAIMVIFVHTKPYMMPAVFDRAYIYGAPEWMAYLNEQVFYSIGQLFAGACNALFFFCSGYLYYIKRPSYLLNLKKKTCSLLLPFLFWNTFWILVAVFFQRANLPFGGIWKDTSSPDIFTVLDWYVGARSGYPFQSALWFLPCLYVVNIIEPVITKLMKRFPVLIGFALLILWAFVPQRVTFLSSYLVFFFLAWYIVQLRPIESLTAWGTSHWEERIVKWACISMLTMFAACIAHMTSSYAVLAYFFQRLSITVNLYLIILVIVYLDQKRFSGLRFLSAFESVSFFSYVLHEPLAIASRRISAQVFSSAYPLVFVYIANSLIILFIFACFGAKLLPRVRSRFSKFYRFATGGRAGAGH